MTAPHLPPPELYHPPADLEQRWQRLSRSLAEQLGALPPTTEAFLLLIGLQHMGYAYGKLSKSEKQDLLQLGMYRVLAVAGYYAQDYVDEEGWPHFVLKKPLPYFEPFSQAVFLKVQILTYLESFFPSVEA